MAALHAQDEANRLQRELKHHAIERAGIHTGMSVTHIKHGGHWTIRSIDVAFKRTHAGPDLRITVKCGKYRAKELATFQLTEIQPFSPEFDAVDNRSQHHF